jgi:hypothetical protein
MNKNLYWSANIRTNKSSEFLTMPLITLKEHLISQRKDVEEFNEKIMYGYLACPAASISLNNIYVVRSGMDMDIKFTETGVSYNTKKIKKAKERNAFLQQFVFLRSHKKKLVTLDLDLNVFSETPMHAIQMQPFLEETEFAKNTGSVVAQFDISKWFRPIQPTFFCYKDEIRIEEGDALYYLFIADDSKIKIKEFEMDEKLMNYQASNTNIKFFKENQALQYLYDFFTKRKIGEKILKRIKNNLL